MHPTAGATEWSNPVQFQVAIPALGICIDNSDDAAKGQVYYVNTNYNRVDTCDWQNHPIFSGIEMAVMDVDRAPVTMTKFPKFYIYIDTDNNKTYIFISERRINTNYRHHGSFTTEYVSDENYYDAADYRYIGTYLGHTDIINDVECLGSAVNHTVTSINTTVSDCYWNLKYPSEPWDITEARNDEDAGIDGFAPFSAHDWSMLAVLGLFMYCSTDFLTAANVNTSDTFTTTGSTSSKMIFRGTQENPEVFIDDMWNCKWCYLSCIASEYSDVSRSSGGYRCYAATYVNRFHNVRSPGSWQLREFSTIVDSYDEVLTIRQNVFAPSGWRRSLTITNNSPLSGVILLESVCLTSEDIDGVLVDDSSLATYTNYQFAKVQSSETYKHFMFFVGGDTDTAQNNTLEPKCGMFSVMLYPDNLEFSAAVRLVKN